MKAIFFSDAHLDKNDIQKIEFVEKFINDVCHDADMVFVLGDLFEFYHGYDGYIFPWYKSIVDSLKNLVEKGKTVYFIEGNHEFHMGDFFENYTGIKCAHSVAMDIEGKETYIAHGYEISKFYLTKFLKTPFVSKVMDTLGPDITWSIATMARVFLSGKKKPYNNKAMDIFREYALKKFDEGYDVLILGHSHMFDTFEHQSGNTIKQYLNTGDIIRYCSYVEYNSGFGFEIKKYTLEPLNP
jgi:UDP-2,3-diacylglucosamine hydrolase